MWQGNAPPFYSFTCFTSRLRCRSKGAKEKPGNTSLTLALRLEIVIPPQLILLLCPPHTTQHTNSCFISFITHRPLLRLLAPSIQDPFLITRSIIIMATDGLPRLRIVSLAEVDDLAKLNEPVEPLARDQAMEIINDIKVHLLGWVGGLHEPLCTMGEMRWQSQLGHTHMARNEGGRSSSS